ncbi:MAG: small-conductance mechanosensitive ion channel [Ramlibacter sp.]|uniref:mechanosensitive ion channel family protein n=1 Tax=Ramlibacter sp. TaxID=1917967 RepID=UPI002627542D|nr:small-conductance mechanosensitive ion channel [Ramlibacter sp.]MDH4376293.1 small-conductance mechanosensitive ion channel [Ramlibacter sp.]
MDTTYLSDWGTALMASLSAALAMLFSSVPKIMGFLIIVLAGWLVASLVERAVAAVLRTIHFNDLSERSGLADFVRKMGTDTDASGVIGLVAKWFIRLIALVVAFDALGLPAVSDVLRQLLLWLPNAVVALVVLVIGGLAARALSNLVRGAAAEGGLGNPDFLAKAANTLVWAFAIVVAVNQIGIATELVNTLFMGFVGALALAAGLSFGLGGRDTAAEIVRIWWWRGREESGAISRTTQAGAARAGGMAGGASSAASGAVPGGASGGTGGGTGGGTLGTALGSAGTGGGPAGFRPSPAGPDRSEGS